MKKAQKNDTGITKNRTEQPDASSEAKKVNKAVNAQPIKILKKREADQAPKMASASSSSAPAARFTKGRTITESEQIKVPVRKGKTFKKATIVSAADGIVAKPYPRTRLTTKTKSANEPASQSRQVSGKLGKTIGGKSVSSASASTRAPTSRGTRSSGASSSSGGAFGNPDALRSTTQKMQSGQL